MKLRTNLVAVIGDVESLADLVNTATATAFPATGTYNVRTQRVLEYALTTCSSIIEEARAQLESWLEIEPLTQKAALTRVELRELTIRYTNTKQWAAKCTFLLENRLMDVVLIPP